MFSGCGRWICFMSGRYAVISIAPTERHAEYPNDVWYVSGIQLAWGWSILICFAWSILVCFAYEMDGWLLLWLYVCVFMFVVSHVSLLPFFPFSPLLPCSFHWVCFLASPPLATHSLASFLFFFFLDHIHFVFQFSFHFPLTHSLSSLFHNTTSLFLIMSESRGELIAWVNELLSLSYTKIEQLGTGTVWKQIWKMVQFTMANGMVNGNGDNAWLDYWTAVDELIQEKWTLHTQWTTWLLSARLQSRSLSRISRQGKAVLEEEPEKRATLTTFHLSSVGPTRCRLCPDHGFHLLYEVRKWIPWEKKTMNERLSRVIVRNARNANAFAHLCDLTPKMLAKGDLPMSRVKFSTKHEYEYLGNYKVLQNCFTSRKIDKVFLYVFASKSHLGSIEKLTEKYINTIRNNKTLTLPCSTCLSSSSFLFRQSRLKSWWNARCRTTLSSCSGWKSSGISTRPEWGTMLPPAAEARAMSPTSRATDLSTSTPPWRGPQTTEVTRDGGEGCTHQLTPFLTPIFFLCTFPPFVT